MSLFKRGGVYWSYVWVDGVRHAKSTGTANRRKAEDADQQHKEELRLRNTLTPNLAPEMRFAELATRFLGEGSAKEWHKDRLTLLLPYFADFSIGKITKGAIRRYREERHKHKRLTETTVNRDIECLRHLLYWAVDEGILPANPIARIRLERERRKKKPVLSLAEEAQLLAAAAPHLQDITVFALDTGMRRGEILNQTWEDVDFSRRLLSVTHSKTPEGEAREIPLSHRVLTLLSGQKKERGMSRSDNTITTLMQVRTVIEAERLAPTVGDLTETLASGSYVAALDHLADLQARIGHMATIVTILRDWERTGERLARKEVHGRTATQAIHRSARAGGVD